MLIVVYDESIIDACWNFNKCSRILINSDIEYSKIIFHKKKLEIEIGDDILIDFRFGDVWKMGGLRPDYFIIGNTCKLYEEARNFLMQSAEKVKGKELATVFDAVRIIEEACKKGEKT